MAYEYKGPYAYDHGVISRWNSSMIGVYYCGYLNSIGKLMTVYVGKGCGDGGIRARLLDHLNEDSWPEVTHFGYRQCTTALEAGSHEANEIMRLQPGRNIVGK